MKISLLVTILFGLILAGCAINDADVKTPPVGTFQAIVEGELQKSNGTAVAYTDIQVISHENGCNDQGVSQGIVTTSEDGLFSKRIVDVVGKNISCITLEISSNPSLNIADTTISYDTGLELKENEPFEEKRISVTYQTHEQRRLESLKISHTNLFLPKE